MDRMRRKHSVRASAPPVVYRGDVFAPAAGTYGIADINTFNLTTQADSGYAPTPVERVAELGAVAPLALAALWEAGFAYEAGPLSTWNN